ncbi:MAG: hypothetical protein H6900_08590 [Rhodobacter sp.]|uniref:hypothetical protein n=1 Tax=Pararhodobacter sp. TaxID=2127056 RepID=UPI001DFFD6F8|nr:hypothetical protein [Pararhodobacter sp.]MCB1346392.1 hypothetical protein [Paracoccaceae bacterium]MCC0073334.1 hypothetical protein [Rhodobacter sp.]HPD93739.1 hypothetical protein [Pararhodobacter sp.]
MSKYHPIDIRHPANRKYQHRNYLLDPPPRAATPASGTTRAAGARTGSAPASFSRKSGQPSGPWGLLQGGGSTMQGSVSQPRKSGLGRIALIVGIFVIYAVLRAQPGLWDQITRQIQQLFYDWGLYRYF